MRVDRKAVLTAYKERKVEAGVFQIRCSATGAVWVGTAPDLSTIKNRLWFTLRLGTERQRSLQEAWNMHGADMFEFEVLERVPDDEPIYSRKSTLRTMLDTWIDSLDAFRL